MQPFKMGLSLQTKLLLLLVTLPLISLGLYLVMAADLFKKDKVAYVFDSSTTVSRSLATQTRIEGQSIYIALRNIAEQYDLNSNRFNIIGRSLFDRNERLLAVLFLRRMPEGHYLQLGETLTKGDAHSQAFAQSQSMVQALRDQAVISGMIFAEYDRLPGTMMVAYRFGAREEPNHKVIVALVQTPDLLGAFQNQGVYSSFVVNRQGRVALGSMDVISTDLDILRPIFTGGVKEGTREVQLSDGEPYLISFSGVGMGDLMVISKVSKKQALKTVEVLLAKSILFFVALLASTLLISVLASTRMTSTLRELFDATARVAKGEFTIQVKSDSRDEVGGLAQSFNWMASQLYRMMRETAEKVRMEHELSTVRTVQETLFPPSRSQFDDVQIAGHFEPASECGGDWWSYSQVGDKIFLWIGDATGHGAPAALITSAARSATAIVEVVPDLTPGKALSILNHAIHETSKGQINMTFFVACIDPTTRTLSYANASHDPPYLIRRSQRPVKKKDLIPLNDVNGPRLGEKKDQSYEEATVEWEPGDLVVLYTDGVMDVQNAEGKKWGEREFLKKVVETANNEGNLDEKLNHLRDSLESFRGNSELIDDVTIVMCEYEKRAA